MNETTTLLVTVLLTLSVSLFFLAPQVSPQLEPLDEEKVQVHWLREGERAPFDGLLINDYTYERIRLKLGK